MERHQPLDLLIGWLVQLVTPPGLDQDWGMSWEKQECTSELCYMYIIIFPIPEKFKSIISIITGMDVDSISVRKTEPPAKALWVGLLGYDHDEVGNQYCCSFPFDKAIDPFGDVILAYEMNGEPIPR